MTKNELARADAVRMWKALRELHAKTDTLVLEMMRHPDATETQIMEMHRTHARIHKDLRETQKQLRAKYPDRMSYADTWRFP